MNHVILIGRLTRDVDVRYTKGEKPTAIARYSLAVDRRFKRENEPSADFINCIAFGKSAEFAEKYFRKGLKIAVEGRLQTGSYEKDGVKHYTTDIIVENQEFCESKGKSENNESNESEVPTNADGFYDIPDDIAQEELPFV